MQHSPSRWTVIALSDMAEALFGIIFQFLHVDGAAKKKPSFGRRLLPRQYHSSRWAVITANIVFWSVTVLVLVAIVAVLS